MARSEEKTDLFGNKYIQHYDDDGREIGRSEARTGIFGDEYTQHTDERGENVGRTERDTGILGGESDQHYSERGEKLGHSEERTDILGSEYEQHYDERGHESGRSEKKTGLFGDEYVEHDNEHRPRPFVRPERPRPTSRPDSDDDDDALGSLIGGILALIAALSIAVLTVGLAALWRYRHVRALFLLFLTLVAQSALLLSLAGQTHFVIAAFLTAAVGFLLYRLCFTAWRWRAESGSRANAWQVSGVLASATLVACLTVGLLQPAFIDNSLGVIQRTITADSGRAEVVPAHASDNAGVVTEQLPRAFEASDNQPTTLDQQGLDQADDVTYETARRANTIEAYDAYLREHPSGRHAEEARVAIQDLEKPTFAPYDLAQLDPRVRAVVERARENEARANVAASRARESAQRAELVVPRAQGRESGTRVTTSTFRQTQRTVRSEVEWSGGTANGYGVQTVIDGDITGFRYAGQFSNGQTNGSGIIFPASNEPILRFEGEFRNDRVEGFGVKYWRSGERFAGIFNENGYAGPGVLYWPDGRRHEGEYANDRSNGYGVLWDPEGHVSQQGMWRNGSFTTPISR